VQLSASQHHDSSVEFITKQVSRKSLRCVCNRNGGEKVQCSPTDRKVLRSFTVVLA
jgi:hypothetical protein